MSEAPVVHLAAGSGIVARRATELLFAPTGSAELVDVFWTSELGGGLEAVTEHCDAGDASAGEFVVLDWSDGLRAAVYGGVELTSNQKRLPRLSGAEAGTWIERSLRTIDGPIEIGVSIDERIETTDLVEGRAQAGGFVLLLHELPEPERAPIRQSAFREPLGGEPLAAAESQLSPAVGEAAEVDLSAGAETEATDLALVEPAAKEVLGMADEPVDVATLRPPFEPESSDPEHDVPGVAGGASTLADQLLSGPGGRPNPYAVGPEDDTVVPTPEMRALVDSLVAGQSAPPSSIDAPLRWQLRIVDGPVEPVDGDLILGRRPQLAANDGPNGARLVVLDGDNLSRSHLRVGIRDGSVFLTDLESKNGSFIVTTGDGQLVQLEPNAERRVDAGTIVQTGSVRFFVEQAGE